MGVDRILDMSRTAVNVTGDLVTCKVVDRLLGGKPEKRFTETSSKIEGQHGDKTEEKKNVSPEVSASEGSNV
jgi:Na+/H+-dicarboxylate symporter